MFFAELDLQYMYYDLCVNTEKITLLKNFIGEYSAGEKMFKAQELRGGSENKACCSNTVALFCLVIKAHYMAQYGVHWLYSNYF